MSGNSPASIKVLYLVSFVPRGRHLPIRIVNARKKIILEDEVYSPFQFCLIPEERRGEVINFEVEFHKNRRVLQGVHRYELDEANVVVYIVREDCPSQILQTYSGTLSMGGGKMWIGRLRQGGSPKPAGMIRILRWTSELPAEPGWYWLRKRDNGEEETKEEKPKIVEVIKGRFGLEVQYPDSDLTEPLKSIAGQWGGPIPQPEESKRS